MTDNPFDPRIFAAPLLAELSASAKDRIARAGKTIHVPAGTQIFAVGAVGDAVYLLLSGKVQLTATPRGHDRRRVLREVGPLDSFGEEGLLGHTRRAEATAVQESVFVSVPGPLFRRAAAVASEAGEGQEIERVARRLRRSATKDILRTALFFRDLPPEDFAMAVDGSKHIERRRSEHVYRAGDTADWLYIVLEGMVQIQEEVQGEVRVTAYLSVGDFFGDDDIVAARERKRSSVAIGECRFLALPARLFRTLADRNMRLLRQLQRTNIERRVHQRSVVEDAAGPDGVQSTRHIFADLYQMQMASSLLTIDQDLCVRCGHCTWTCSQVHGVARIVRRGEKTLARLDVAGREGAARSLMLPNSCQHCRNPVCMIDCPTAAVGREPGGEVFIREELCTGCSNCAKACPWDNIQMAPRPKSLPIAQSLMADPGQPAAAKPPDVAVKCELCRDYNAPACVSACPTEAILRLDPSTDFRDVAALIGGTRKPRRSLAERVNASWPLGLAVVGVVLGIRLQPSAVFSAAGVVGFVAGLAGLAAIGVCVSYVIPKRIPGVWLRRRGPKARPEKDKIARSKVRRFLAFHIGAGLIACGVVGLHTQMRIPNNVAGAAALSFWLVSLLGATSLAAYRWLPRRLTRLERKGLLPEDFAAESERAEDRFRKALQDQDPALRATSHPLLLAYRQAPLASLGLVLGGRSLKEEERRLHRQLAARIPPAMSGVDANFGDAVRSAVALRALPARVWLTRALRFWLPLHMVATAVLLGLLGVHILASVAWWFA